MPNPVARALAFFDPGLRSVINGLGQRPCYSSEKAHQLLGWKPRTIEQTIVDTAQSLINQPGQRAIAA